MSLVDTYHAYVFGTSFWYGLRGAARVYDPSMVSGWFRPPSQPTSRPSDLELYTIWTDGFQLLALALLLLAMADAVPLPDWLPNITPNDASASKAKKQYARAAVLITIFHHVTTGIGAYQHWAKPSHHTVAMDIGVYGNVFFTVLGALALLFGLSGEPRAAVAKKHV